MALVRCPKHNIPYNDANPRGCPACWQERDEGGKEAQLMRELARASRGLPSVEILPPEPDKESKEPRHEGWPPPVTQPPRLPVPEPTGLERIWRFVKAHRPAVGLAVASTIVLSLVYVITRPDFVEEYDPPLITEAPRPFPVPVNLPLDGVFALLGSVAPSTNPDSGILARYVFGEGVAVDALNGVVYAVTLTTTRRSWNGNQVGVSERVARGRLALLGEITERDGPMASPFLVGGYQVYGSPNARPRQSLVTAVRPPNGCYDVQVDLAPQVIGRVLRGDETFAAVARRGGAMQWVAVQVRVVSRALAGPYAGRAACEAS